MELQDVSKQSPETIKHRFPLEIRDHGRLLGVVVSPEVYERSYKQLVCDIRALAEKIRLRRPMPDKEIIKSLLEIDDDEYAALGFGHEYPG